MKFLLVSALALTAALTATTVALSAEAPPPTQNDPPQQASASPADHAPRDAADQAAQVSADDPREARADLVAMLTGKKIEWFKTFRDLALGPMTGGTQKDYDEAEKQILEVNDPDAIEPLAIVLYNQSTRWRSTFLKAATQYARGSSEFARRVGVAYLSDMAVKDDNAVLRGKARAALMHPDTPRQPQRLQQLLLNSPEAGDRDRAAGLLADLKDKGSLRQMVELLTTEEWHLKGVEIESRKVQMDVRVTHTGVPTFTTVPVQAAVPGMGIATGYIQLPNVRVTSVNTTVFAPAGFKFTPDWEMVVVRHPGMLLALEKLTGKDFGYDKEAWRRWLDAQKIPDPSNPYNIDWDKK